MIGRAAVVAVGARTPVGLCSESAAAAVRCRISRVGEHPSLVDGAGGPLKAAWDPFIDDALTGPGRLIALAMTALEEVAFTLVSQRPLPTLPVFLALPEPRPGFGPGAVQEVLRGIASAVLPGVARLEVQAIIGGHAAAIRALELAYSHLEQRKAEVCVVGGTDSYLDADTLDWLDGKKRLAQDEVRGGFIPGEAAGMVAVASHDARAALGLPVLAHIRGIATGQEPRSIDCPEGLLGEVLSQVIQRATADIRVTGELVDDIYCDINGERHRTDDWGFTLLRIPSVFRDGTAYVAAADCWGDVGAASGALGCVLAVQAWRRGYANGSRALICGSSDGGLRGSILLVDGNS